MKRVVYGVGSIGIGSYCTYMSDGTDTKEYSVWSQMLRRCYNESSLKRRPTYIVCKVADEFKNFQVFSDWATKQVGFGLINYDMDKDILAKDNIYSRDTIAFIPESLNSFLTGGTGLRGKYPVGLGFRERSSKFEVKMLHNKVKVHIGTFFL